LSVRLPISTKINARLVISANWIELHGRFEMKRINHEEAYNLNGACTNCAEEFFSRMRRGEIGHHHHIAGAYLLRYAQEASWREDYRRTSNGDQVQRLSGPAVNSGKEYARKAASRAVRRELPN
jgi:ISXO2 transposase-like protein